MALRIATKKNAPRKIPLSGEKLKKRDYRYVTYTWQQENKRFLVDSMEGNHVSGQFWADDKLGYSGSAILALSEFDAADFRIHIYRGVHEFIEHDELMFVIRQSFGFYTLGAKIGELRIWWFGRKPPVLIHRMDLLKIMIDLSLTSPDWTFNRISAFGQLYPREIVLNRHIDRIRNEFALIVASFEAENLIKTLEPNKIQLNPQALSAYSNYFDQKRTENNSMRLQITLLIVSVFALIAAGAQAVAAFLKVCPLGPG